MKTCLLTYTTNFEKETQNMLWLTFFFLHQAFTLAFESLKHFCTLDKIGIILILSRLTLFAGQYSVKIQFSIERFITEHFFHNFNCLQMLTKNYCLDKLTCQNVKLTLSSWMMQSEKYNKTKHYQQEYFSNTFKLLNILYFKVLLCSYERKHLTNQNILSFLCICMKHWMTSIDTILF